MRKIEIQKCDICHMEVFQHTLSKQFDLNVCLNCNSKLCWMAIPKRFRQARLLKIKISDKYLNVVKNYFNNDKGLFVTGTIGSGKTYLACAIAYENFFKYGRITTFNSTLKIFAELKEAIQNGYSYEPIIFDLSKDLIILDDMGSERPTEFVVEILDRVINHRNHFEENKFIITSNLSLQQIGELFSDRIASRIFEMCDTIVTPAQDLRLLKNKLIENKNIDM